MKREMYALNNTMKGVFMEYEQIYWLIIIIIFLAVEIITTGLTTLWFAIGAILAFLASLLGLNLTIQITVFIVSSILLFVGFFPFVRKRLGANGYNTNVDSLIGKEAVITEDIKFNVVGKASVNGVIWSATSKEELDKGTTVKIEKISGNKLIVTKIN